MIVSINQPAYLPWLGYFHRIAASDLHIVLDHVQFEKNSYTNRNKVRTKDGWCWLTVPLKTKGRFGTLGINQLEISNESDWANKHWRTIKFNYSKSPFFPHYQSFFERIYDQNWDNFMGLADETNSYLLKTLEIKTPIIHSSEMDAAGLKDELVLNLCREVGATLYLSGPLGRNYLRSELFENSGIKVAYQDYVHPTYPQVYPGFEPFMSAIDLLFNCGPESLDILMKDQETITE